MIGEKLGFLCGWFYLPFGSDEGDGKTPPFRTGMESSLIVMYRSCQQYINVLESRYY